jgi:predicted DNA-binding transcriptional regulator AlpA
MTEGLRRIIRVRDLPQWTGLGRTRNSELIAKGDLPTPFSLTENGRAKGIFEDDLIEWQRRKRAAGLKITATAKRLPPDEEPPPG